MLLWYQGHLSCPPRKADGSQGGWTVALPKPRRGWTARMRGAVSAAHGCVCAPPKPRLSVEWIGQTEIIPGDLGGNNERK